MYILAGNPGLFCAKKTPPPFVWGSGAFCFWGNQLAKNFCQYPATKITSTMAGRMKVR